MEDKIKNVLSKPMINPSMDNKLLDKILNYDPAIDGTRCSRYGKKRMGKQVVSYMNYNISKIAIATIIIILFSTGTAIASGLFIKSYKVDIVHMKEKDIDLNKLEAEVVERIKKNFGTGNKMITLLMDGNGKPIELGDDGYYTFEDGSKYLAPFIPDVNRHENDKKSGEEAFSYMGFPDLVPTYLYDNYVVYDGGFHYEQVIYKSDPTSQSIFVEFFSDDYYNNGEASEEKVYMQFTSRENASRTGVIYLDNENNNSVDEVHSSYTTKSGIICSLVEEGTNKNIMAHISFESDTIGDGQMSLEFVGMERSKVESILETIPLSGNE